MIDVLADLKNRAIEEARQTSVRLPLHTLQQAIVAISEARDHIEEIRGQISDLLTDYEEGTAGNAHELARRLASITGYELRERIFQTAPAGSLPAPGTAGSGSPGTATETDPFIEEGKS